MIGIPGLPDEMSGIIYDYLPIKDKQSTIPSVCRGWYALSLRQLRYDSKQIASKMLEDCKATFCEKKFLKLSSKNFFLDLTKKRLKDLEFHIPNQNFPEECRIKFGTTNSQKFTIFEYSNTSRSNTFKIYYNQKKEKFNSKCNINYLRFTCYIGINIITATSRKDVSFSSTPGKSFSIITPCIPTNSILKTKILPFLGCQIEVEKHDIIQGWKQIKSPEQYDDEMNFMLAYLQFHLVSHIESIARYNFQVLKCNTIDEFKEKKIFTCNEWGKILTEKSSSLNYNFELIAKEVSWDDGKKVITLQWANPCRFTKTDFFNRLRHFVISRTTEFLVKDIGLLEF